MVKFEVKFIKQTLKERKKKMNEELKTAAVKTAAYIEDSHLKFDGIDINYEAERTNNSNEEFKEHGIAKIGAFEGSFEGFVAHEAWKEMIKGSVTITLECIKHSPEVIKPIFGLLIDAIRMGFELRKQKNEIRKMELELELKKSASTDQSNNKTTKAE